MNKKQNRYSGSVFLYGIFMEALPSSLDFEERKWKAVKWIYQKIIQENKVN